MNFENSLSQLVYVINGSYYINMSGHHMLTPQSPTVLAITPFLMCLRNMFAPRVLD